LNLDLFSVFLEISLSLGSLGFLDALSVGSVFMSGMWKGDSRLVNELGPDPFHVFVRLDHLGVVVIRSSEKDIVLGSEFTRNWNLVKGDFVAIGQLTFRISRIA
jgi:hypothetical protein